jgi:YesN/AraC family two-component response regulator
MNEEKGLWGKMREQGNRVSFDLSKPISEEELIETFELLRKQDEERRKRMDKEYTPIEQITLKDIEDELAKWGNDLPRSLMAKVKIAGMYSDLPIGVVKVYLEAVQREVDKLKLK